MKRLGPTIQKKNGSLLKESSLSLSLLWKSPPSLEENELTMMLSGFFSD